MAYSAPIAEVLDELELESTALMGFDLGAQVALADAVHYPSCVGHLVLLIGGLKLSAT